MSESIYPVPTDIKKNAHIDREAYKAMYQRSIDEPESFWAEQAKAFLTWEKPWDTVCSSGRPYVFGTVVRQSRRPVASSAFQPHR